MPYTPLFDPDELGKKNPRLPGGPVAYLYDEPLLVAINVALAARRPLLLRGNPGTGKSTLAEDVAWKMGRRYLFEVITSRTQARDLQWRFDAVLRLAEAQPGVGGQPGDVKRYVRPGVLWHAFSPRTASRQGLAPSAEGVDDRDAVLLLDEIDKADPDVPNDMLNLIEQRRFVVDETSETVAGEGMGTFIMLTTNGERELPAAFLRRCVAYQIPDPEPTRLKEIVRHHERSAADRLGPLDEALLDEMIKLLATLKERAGDRRPPGTAELLDAVMACRRLGVRSNSDVKWQAICEAALWKHGVEERAPR
jgi:MoxR-like ATPase